MEFETNAQQEVYEKIEPWMKELFGIFSKKREDAPFFGVNIGSSFVHVGVHSWGEDDATITVRSYVVTSIEINQELLEFLLVENDSMRFGAFGMDKDKDIFFEYTLIGSTSSIEDIKDAVLAVGYTADKYDDQIIQKWGGEPVTQEIQF